MIIIVGSCGGKQKSLIGFVVTMVTKQVSFLFAL